MHFMANWIRLTITPNDEAASHWEAYWHWVRMVVRVLAPSSSVPVAACEKVGEASRKLRIVWLCSVIIDTERLWEREVINSTALGFEHLDGASRGSQPDLLEATHCMPFLGHRGQSATRLSAKGL